MPDLVLIIAVVLVARVAPRKYGMYFDWQLIQLAACGLARMHFALDSAGYRIIYYATTAPIWFAIYRIQRDA